MTLEYTDTWSVTWWAPTAEGIAWNTFHYDDKDAAIEFRDDMRAMGFAANAFRIRLFSPIDTDGTDEPRC